MTARAAVTRFTVVAIGIPRGLLWVAIAYTLASWVVLLTYDRGPFPASYVLSYAFANTHLGLALVFFVGVTLLGSYRGYRVELASVDAEADAALLGRFRRAEAIGAGVASLGICAAGWLSHRVLPVLDRGVPHLAPSSTFLMDRASRRPTVVVETNAHGFRDREWPAAAPSGDAYRVVLVGDSIVFGSGIREGRETLTRVTQEILDHGRPSGAEVYNLSLNGLNFAQQVDLVERHARTIGPNLVVVLHNEENDLMPVLPYYDRPALMAAFPLAFIGYVNALDRFMRGHRLSDGPGALDRMQVQVDRLARLSAEARFGVLFVYLRGNCPPPYHRPPSPETGSAFSFAELAEWRAELTFPNDFHPNPTGVRWMASSWPGSCGWCGTPAPSGDPATIRSPPPSRVSA